MARSTASQVPRRVHESDRRFDRYFFPGFAVLILATVFYGFAPTYFLAGMFWAHLPSIFVHIHAALFTAWIVLVTVQITLVRVRRTHWHRRLGVTGLVLAPLMLAAGIAALIVFVRRQGAPAPILRIIALQDILSLCSFAMLLAWAFVARRDSPTHKRLMVLATFVILGPAIARWPGVTPTSFDILFAAFPALLMLYDFVTRRVPHRATLSGGLITLAIEFSAALAQSEPMNHLITWIQGM